MDLCANLFARAQLEFANHVIIAYIAHTASIVWLRACFIWVPFLVSVVSCAYLGACHELTWPVPLLQLQVQGALPHPDGGFP